MVRHIVLFRWVDGTTPDQVDAIAARLTALTDVIPEIRSYSVGTDLGYADGNFQFAVVAELDDHDAWETYRVHPDHRKVITELITPVLADRAAIQYEVQ